MFTSHGETANGSPHGLSLFSHPFHAIAPLAVAIGELGQGQQPPYSSASGTMVANTICYVKKLLNFFFALSSSFSPFRRRFSPVQILNFFMNFDFFMHFHVKAIKT